VGVLNEALILPWRREEALGALYGVVTGPELRRSEEVEEQASIISNAAQARAREGVVERLNSAFSRWRVRDYLSDERVVVVTHLGARLDPAIDPNHSADRTGLRHLDIENDAGGGCKTIGELLRAPSRLDCVPLRLRCPGDTTRRKGLARGDTELELYEV
jgi:hypothetical protein